MTVRIFTVLLTSRLVVAGVKDAGSHASQFARDNPGIETEMTPEQAAGEWLSAHADAEDWRDPARYGAS